MARYPVRRVPVPSPMPIRHVAPPRPALVTPGSLHASPEGGAPDPDDDARAASRRWPCPISRTPV